MPKKQPKQGRRWLADGSCLRLRPEYSHHACSSDFFTDHTYDGRVLKTLAIIDEHSQTCLALFVARQVRSSDVIDLLTDLMVEHGARAYLRSDNGPEMVAKNFPLGWRRSAHR